MTISMSPARAVRTESDQHESLLPLSSIEPGASAVVQHLKKTSGNTRQRLMEMGLTRGTVIKVIRFAPLGDPMEISVRGYRLSLRKDEASSVMVRRIPSRP